jgi:hypothetical protein
VFVNCKSVRTPRGWMGVEKSQSLAQQVLILVTCWYNEQCDPFLGARNKQCDLVYWFSFFLNSLTLHLWAVSSYTGQFAAPPHGRHHHFCGQYYFRTKRKESLNNKRNSEHRRTKLASTLTQNLPSWLVFLLSEFSDLAFVSCRLTQLYYMVNLQQLLIFGCHQHLFW